MKFYEMDCTTNDLNNIDFELTKIGSIGAAINGSNIAYTFNIDTTQYDGFIVIGKKNDDLTKDMVVKTDSTPKSFKIGSNPTNYETYYRTVTISESSIVVSKANNSSHMPGIIVILGYKYIH